MQPFAVLLAATAVAACTSRAPDDSPPVVRLVERVDGETVLESPLLDLPPDEEALAVVAQREVFADDFERGDAADYRWQASPRRPHFQPLDGGGRGWCWSGDAGPPAAILLPALPGQRYRVERTLLAGPDGPDLQVVERADALSTELPFNPPDAIEELARSRLRDMLTIHRFPPAPRQRPATGRVDLLTSPATASLMIVFDRDAVGARGRRTQACVDALRVARLETTRDQELALARSAWPGQGEQARRGFVKRGQLLPLGRFSDAVPPFDHNLDHRDGLFAPTPTTFRFVVNVPEDGRLSFSYALARSASPGDEATFQVAIAEPEGATTRLFEERLALDAEGRGWHWHEADLDLAAWAGREVSLRLATRGGGAERPVHALWGSPIIDRPRRSGEPPNVLLLGLDTLRADRLSSYGYERSTTPHLDALAAAGVRFDQAVSTAPWTAPSFASIFTGRMPTAHGVVDRLTTLSTELTTLPEHFARAGWRTQAFAFKPFLFNLGFEQGFDHWFNVPRLDRTAEDAVAKALVFLDRHGDRRFFLFLHLDDPHEPLRQPPPWDTRFAAPEALERFGLELPVNVGLWPGRGCDHCRDDEGLVPEYQETASALYDGAVAYMDDRLGRLFGELERRGLWNDTLVVAVSDHGETLWDRAGRFGHGNSVAEELVRAVLIVKPQRGSGLPRGEVVDDQVRLTDLAPTLIEIAGLGAPAAEADSRSLVPLMAGERRAESGFALSENPRSGMLAVRRAGWKYVTVHRPGKAALERLHDLAADPRELRDARGRRPDLLPGLREPLVEHVLRNRRGRYLLALGDGEGRRWSIELEAGGTAPPVMPFFGLVPEASKGDRVVLSGFSDGALLTLLEVGSHGGSDPPTAVLRADGREWDRRSGDAFLAARPGLLEALSQRGAGLYFVGVSGGSESPLAASESAENLEQLRALGYVD